MTGIVTGYEIKKNRDGLNKVLLLNCSISSDKDIQTVEYMSHAGDDHIPPIGSVVTILQAGKAWKIAIASNNQNDFDDTLNEGERNISSPGGSYIRWNDDGTIEINGNAKSAVSYSDLNIALQLLVTSINANLALKLDGAGSAGTSTLDISAAEVSEVKLP